MKLKLARLLLAAAITLWCLGFALSLTRPGPAEHVLLVIGYLCALAALIVNPPLPMVNYLRQRFGLHSAEQDGLVPQNLLNVLAGLSLILLLVIWFSSATLVVGRSGGIPNYYRLGYWESPALRWLSANTDPVEFAVQVTALLALSASPFLWLVQLVRRQLTRRRRLRSGQCPWCGYDLRASPTRCTECGTPVDEQLVQSMTPFPRVIAGLCRMKDGGVKRTKAIAHWIATVPERELEAGRLRRRARRNGHRQPSDAP